MPGEKSLMMIDGWFEHIDSGMMQIAETTLCVFVLCESFFLHRNLW